MNGLTKFIKTNASSILIGGALASTVLGVATSITATPKALELIEEKKLNTETKEETLRAIKTLTPCYIPAIGFTLLSCVCMLSANTISTKREATLTAAYTATIGLLNKYKQGIHESPDEQNIKKKIMSKDSKGVALEGGGDALFYEEYSGRYFYSTLKEVEAAEYELNQKFLACGKVCLNDFFVRVGLDPTPLGDSVGWTMAFGNDDGCNYIEFDNWEMEVDIHKGYPIYYIEFLTLPTSDYY